VKLLWEPGKILIMKNKMAPKAVLNRVNALSNDNVISVYSGRPGCCCGCRGNHRHSTRFPNTGVYDYTVFNDRQVTKIINVLKEFAKLPGMLKEFDIQDDYVAFQTDSRLFIAYTGE
jgi:hypothetical protein